MKSSGKNFKGFISLSFVFVLMTFLSLYLTATFAIALSQQRDYVRSTCVTEATDIQSAALKNARELFALNKASTTLRVSIKTTKVALALAVASLNLEAIPPLEKQLNALYEAQKILDAVQQTLITKAKGELLAQHVALIAKLNHGQQESSAPWRFMLTMSSYFTPRFTPALAIRPDPEGGVGPNYEWQDQAEKKQTLAYSWNMYFQTNESYQRFFKWINVLSIQCSVAPSLGDKQWQLTINADK